MRMLRNRSVLVRTLHQARILKRQAKKFRDTAAELIEKGRIEAERQSKGLYEAVHAGKNAYQRVAG